jgi:hypothetical protein
VFGGPPGQPGEIAELTELTGLTSGSASRRVDPEAE